MVWPSRLVLLAMMNDETAAIELAGFAAKFDLSAVASATSPDLVTILRQSRRMVTEVPSRVKHYTSPLDALSSLV